MHRERPTLAQQSGYVSKSHGAQSRRIIGHDCAVHQHFAVGVDHRTGPECVLRSCAICSALALRMSSVTDNRTR